MDIIHITIKTNVHVFIVLQGESRTVFNLAMDIIPFREKLSQELFLGLHLFCKRYKYEIARCNNDLTKILIY